MIVEVGVGTVGKNDTSWGSTADGLPVLLVRTPLATVRIVFTPEEAKEHGGAAIYLAYAAMLSRQNGAAKSASPLIGPDGGPLS